MQFDNKITHRLGEDAHTMNQQAKENMQKLQMYEQSLQNFLLQRQNHQAQLSEVSSALKELEATDDAYQIIGNVMVKKSKDELKKHLEERKETAEIRIQSIEKQEVKVREKIEALQKDMMEEMKNAGA